MTENQSLDLAMFSISDPYKSSFNSGGMKVDQSEFNREYELK